MRKFDDPYMIVRRIDWIRNRLLHGQPFNSTDVVAEFNISARTEYRDMRFVRNEYFNERLKYDIAARTFYLV